LPGARLSLEVRPFEPAFAEAWDALVRRARNGHFMFERRFMTYHADRFEDASVVVLAAGEVVGALPANHTGEAVYSHQGLTFGGLIVERLRAAELLEALDAAAVLYAAQGARRLVYKPLPWIYHRRPAQEDLYWLVRRGARRTRCELTSTIRLSAPGDPSTRRRRGASAATKRGVRFGRSERWSEYWRLLGEVLGARHGVAPVHTAEEIQRLAAQFPDNIALHVAEDAVGNILAGIVLFITAEVAHAQYLANGAAGREAGALDGLILHLLEAPPPGVSYFDFGISNEDQGGC
jgi:hypothetical protein